jgi:antitoxin ParD1/3/4
MNVNLGPVFDEFVSEMLNSGLYQSQSEILREGLRLLKEREEEKRLRFAELRKQIALGAKQADRGELVNGDQVFAQIRRRSSQRKRTRK